jgi:hypothetical protein
VVEWNGELIPFTEIIPPAHGSLSLLKTEPVVRGKYTHTVGLRKGCSSPPAYKGDLAGDTLCFVHRDVRAAPNVSIPLRWYPGGCTICKGVFDAVAWTKTLPCTPTENFLNFVARTVNLVKAWNTSVEDSLTAIVRTYGIVSEGVMSAVVSMVAGIAASSIKSKSWSVSLSALLLFVLGWASLVSHLIHVLIHTWMAWIAVVGPTIVVARSAAVSRILWFLDKMFGPTVGGYLGERVALMAGRVEGSLSQDFVSDDSDKPIAGAARALHEALVQFQRVTAHRPESALRKAAPYTRTLSPDANKGIVQLGFKLDGDFIHVGFATRVAFSGFDGLLTPAHNLIGNTGVFASSEELWVKHGAKMFMVPVRDVKPRAKSKGLDGLLVEIPQYAFSILGCKSRRLGSPPVSFFAKMYAPLDPLSGENTFSGDQWYQQSVRLERSKKGFLLPHTFDTVPGMSGLPIVNSSGAVVAMHIRGADRSTKMSHEGEDMVGFNLAVRVDLFPRFVQARKLASSGMRARGRPETTASDYDDYFVVEESIAEWEDKFRDRSDGFDFEFEGRHYRYSSDDDDYLIADYDDGEGRPGVFTPGLPRFVAVESPELVGKPWWDDDLWSDGYEGNTLPGFRAGGLLEPPTKLQRIPQMSLSTPGENKPKPSTRTDSASLGLENAQPRSSQASARKAPPKRSSSSLSKQPAKLATRQESTSGPKEGPKPKEKASSIRVRFTILPGGKRLEVSTTLSEASARMMISALSRAISKSNGSIKKSSTGSESQVTNGTGSGKQ